MKALHFGVFAVAALMTSVAIAEDAPEPTDNVKASNALFGKFGYDTKADVSGSSCKVIMKLDQKTFLENIDTIQKLGLINSDLSKEKINSSPNSISFAFVIQMLPVATKAVFDDNKDVQNCQFAQNVDVIDDYGNTQSKTILTYGFSRTTYKRVNWDNLKNMSMMKIATRFHLSTDFAASIQSEMNQ